MATATQPQAITLSGEVRRWGPQGYGFIHAEGRIFYFHGRNVRYSDGWPLGWRKPGDGMEAIAIGDPVTLTYFPSGKHGENPAAVEVRLTKTRD